MTKKTAQRSSGTSSTPTVLAPSGIASTASSISAMTTTDPFLFGIGECNEPIPTPPLTRRYRFNSLAPMPAVDGLPMSPPATTSSLLAKAMSFGAKEAATSLGEFLDGVPVNALSLETEKGVWTQPLLREVVVSDIAELARTGAVAGRGERVRVAIDGQIVAELARGRPVVAPLVGAGTKLVRLVAAGGAVRNAPRIVQVTNVNDFCAAPTVTLPGMARPLTLSAAQRGDLATGKPVVVGRGTETMVLIGSAAHTETSQAAMSASSIETGLGVVVVAPAPPATSGPPPAVVPGGGNPPPPPPRSGNPGGSGPPAVVELALLVPYEQRWTLKTYERGELISSIALTPLEEVTIDVFSWDRRKSSVEDTSASEAERVAEGQSVDRDTRDVFSELTRNSSFNWGLKAELSAGVPKKFGVTLGGNAGGGNTLNDIARRTTNTVQEATVKSTEKVKSSRQTKITEAVEEGSETRTTRKLRNANQAHPVTYNYFEVLARYGVKTDCVVAEIMPVVTIAAPGGRLVVDIDFVRANETVLRRGLLTTTVAIGFDAARTLWMRERACNELCRQCLCSPTEPSASSPLFASAAAAAVALARAIMQMPPSGAAVDWRRFFNGIAPLPSGTAVPVSTTHDDLRRSMFLVALQYLQPGLWNDLQGAARALNAATTPTAAQVAALYAAISNVDPALFDRALVPDAQLKGVLQSHVSQLVFAAYAVGARVALADMIANHIRGTNQVLDLMIDGIARFPISNEGQARGLIASVILYLTNERIGFDATVDGGTRNLIQPAKDAIRPWIDERSAQDQAARAAEAAAKAAREANIASMFPPAKVLASRERFDALKRHIEDNNDYYAFLLLTEQIALGRYVAPPVIGTYAPAVLPRPVAVVDGLLCFPLDPDAPGMTPAFERVTKLAQTIVNEGKEVDVTLPTPGFVIEPKLSMCSAAEPYVEEARRIELQQRQALADQAHAEAKRRGSLVSGPNPVLDPFDAPTPAIRIALDTPTP